MKRLINPAKKIFLFRLMRLKYRIESFKQIFFDELQLFCFAYEFSFEHPKLLAVCLNKASGIGASDVIKEMKCHLKNF